MHRVLGPRALSLGQRGAWQTRAISEKITFPALSPTMTEGRVAQWKKAVGDKIRPGDILASVETDKATLDWEWAGDEGYIAQVAAQPEGAVKVGAEIGVWVETEEELAEGGRLVLGAPSGGAAPPPAAAASVAAPAPPAAAPAAPPVSPALRGIVERSGPAVQKLFHDSRDVDLSAVTPTGKGGRFTKEDLLKAPLRPPQSAHTPPPPAAAAAAAPATPAAPAVPVSPPPPPTATPATAPRAVPGQRRFAVSTVAGQRRLSLL